MTIREEQRIEELVEDISNHGMKYADTSCFVLNTSWG